MQRFGQFRIHVFALAILLLTAVLAYGAVPHAINYQGYLTDTAGPVDGTVGMTFRIYDAETGGTALWEETHAGVAVAQGVYNVVLGSVDPSGNPLDILFDSQYYLGITVGTDGEMTPRQALTGIPYALNADTVDGQHAGEFAASSHSHAGSDITSPVGDADTVDGAHAAALEESAEIDADIASHGSNASAHHSRYSNTEAVNAMGAVSDSNALNHTKYTNANAVDAIKAADGAGSTLDADLVDGLQANEIIDAAQDEVRTPISSLPFTISTSGSYYLTSNLDGSSGGIDITADDVTLDLMGFTMNGGGAISDYGISFNGCSNITIINGTIKGFGKAGIYQGNSTARYATVMDVKVLGNGTQGAYTQGIYIDSTNSHVERCTAGGNGGGIYLSASSKLINNTAYSNSGGGIYGGSFSTLSGNTAYSNSGSGIYGGSGSTLSGNTAYSNTGTYGIFGGNGSTFSGNTVSTNSHWGIFASGSSLIKDNNIYYNNTSATTGEGGLRVGHDSRVVGNTLDGNKGNNIRVYSSGNTIENNLVTDSANGIFFNVSGNFYGNNRASGNTTNFNLNGTTQTTNAYLPNISY